LIVSFAVFWLSQTEELWAEGPRGRAEEKPAG
jgi:hypothetical protein